MSRSQKNLQVVKINLKKSVNIFKKNTEIIIPNKIRVSLVPT